MDYPKSVPNVGLVNGKFIDENTVTGAVGSLIPCEWGNAVTDEVLTVIRAAELNPQEGKNDQLYQAIQKLVGEASTLPVGALVAFPVNTIAPGFLELDGSIKSIAAYPDLAAYLGTAFNKGDEGAGNFRLPESRGEFLRGWDHGRGVDAGRAVGSYQVGTKVQGDDGVGPTVQGIANVAQIDADPAPGFAADINYTSTGLQSGSFGAAYWRTVRPRNLAVMWCIKAWGAPINQGNIDVAALVPLAAQATETNRGTAKIATQEQIEAGASDDTIVTPAKLKFGFSALFAATGWIRLPKFLGGLTLSWQQASVTSAGLTVTLPIAVANKFLGIWAQHLGPKGGPAYTCSMSFDEAAKSTVNITGSVSGAAAFTILVLSY